MNDRFKFRVWDIQNKEYASDLYITTDGVLFSSEDYMGENEALFILEQCTGLKDKNGDLICEGDIVKYFDKNFVDDPIEVEVIYDGDKTGFCVLKDNESRHLSDIDELEDMFLNKIEIIGNIHTAKQGKEE